ncbi:MAG: LuxR C-terminal-related transcriptional regulator [Thermoleophilia bacterium]
MARDTELAAIERAVAPAAGPAGALLREGPAGIGKTTLWQAAVEAARAAGLRVLAARPAQAEIALPFAALGDLLGGVDPAALAALPAPQRRALDAALQRGPAEDATSLLAVARATRALVDAAPTAIAIDDVQWLDEPTAHAVAFVARRARGLRLVLARRTEIEEPAPLGLDTAPVELTRLRIGPLDPRELASVVDARLGVRLSREAAEALHAMSGGSPFHALEVVRASAGGATRIERAGRLRLPESAAALLAGRLADLPEAARAAVLLAATLAQPTRAAVEAATGDPDGVAAALASGVLVAEGDRLRFDHPLLAATARASASEAERRDAHRRLAEVVAGDERGIHLALATEQPDERVADALAGFAAAADARRARRAAAELAEHAARLTPTDPDRRERLLAAAALRLRAGDGARSAGLHEQALVGVGHGRERAAILEGLGNARYVSEDVPAALAALAEAEVEAAGDAALAARIEHARAFLTCLAGQIDASLATADRALALARAAGDPGLVALARARVAVNSFAAGLGFDRASLEEAIADERYVDGVPYEWLPSFALSSLAGHADDAATARRVFEELHRPAIERDGELALPLLLYQSQFASWAGDWDDADALAREAVELAQLGVPPPSESFALGLQALADAHRGRVDAARRNASAARRIAEEHGALAPLLTAVAALGFLELSRGEPADADALLAPLVESTLAAGVREPSFLRFLPDAVEARCALGRGDEARAALARFEERARAVGRRSMIAAACRCRALLASAAGAHDEARAALAEAGELHAALDQPFERARTLLVAGRVERRAGGRAAAREALTGARAAFARLGAPLWEAQAAAELERLPGRRPAGGGLTDTQRRIASLVAAGRSNREIADALFVSVRTVEANLTRIYRHLGVRSRAELAGRIAGLSAGGDRPTVGE